MFKHSFSSNHIKDNDPRLVGLARPSMENPATFVCDRCRIQTFNPDPSGWTMLVYSSIQLEENGPEIPVSSRILCTQCKSSLKSIEEILDEHITADVIDS